MATLTLGTSGNYTWYLNYSMSQDIANNTSTISYNLWIRRNVSAANGAWWGTPARTFNVDIGGQVDSEAFASIDFRNAQDIYFTSGSFVYGHNADGTRGAVAVYASVSGSYVSSGFPVPTSVGGATISFPTIPRAATSITRNSGTETGSATSLSISPLVGSFTYELRYKSPLTTAWTLVASVAGTSWPYSFTLGHNEIPNATSGTIQYQVITKSGGTQIGSATEASFTYSVPGTVVPVLGAATWAEGATTTGLSTLTASGAVFAQGWSRLKPTFSATPGTGATLSSAVASVSGHTGTVSSGGTFPEGITTQGVNATFSITATDSRGRTDTDTGTVPNVHRWSLPTASAGTPVITPTGGGATQTIALSGLSATTTSFYLSAAQRNVLETRTGYRDLTTGGAWIYGSWTARALSTSDSIDNAYAPGTALTVATGLDPTHQYQVSLQVRDIFGANAVNYSIGTPYVESSLIIPAQNVLVAFDGNTRVGIKKVPTQGDVDVAGEVYIENGLRVSTRSYVDNSILAARTVQANITGITTTGWTAQVLSSGATITGRLRDRLWAPKVGDPITATINNEGIWYFEPMNLRGYVEASISLASGWVPYNDEFNLWNENGPWRNGRAVRTSSGVVVLGGLITNNGAAVANGTIIGTLPVGFRPDSNEIYPCVTGGSNAHGRLFVQTDGTIRVYGHTGTWISLSNVKFPTGLTWTNATLENSFNVFSSTPVSGFPYSTPGHAIDSDGVVWLRGNVARNGVPADGTSIFTLPVGRGPRIGYQHHHPASAGTGFACIGVGTQGATDRTVDYKTVGNPGVGSIHLGGIAIVSESFTGLDGVISGAPSYGGINGWYPRSAVTPDGLVLLSGLTSTLTAGTVIGYVGNAMRVSRRLVCNAAQANGHTRVDAYRGGQVVNASGGTSWYSIESAFIADNQITRLEFS